MFERILFPTDGSDQAAAALEYALDVASAHDATLHVLNVADTTRDSVVLVDGDVTDVLEDEGERVVEEAASRARDRGVDVVTEVLQGEPHSTIVDYSDTSDVDLVVMPTRGGGRLERFLLGSVTRRVVDTASVPVLAVPPDDDRPATYPPGDVLVATDGSRNADAAVQAGVDVARDADAALHLLHVVDTAALGFDVRSAMETEHLEEHANRVLSAATESADAASLADVTTAIEYGQPHSEIRSYVDDHGVDLVAVGAHGDADRPLLGGVAAKLLRSSPVPVLVVRSTA